MVDHSESPSVEVASHGSDSNILEAKKYYTFNKTGNILLTTTTETNQLVEEEVRNVFSEVSVFYAAMTRAISQTKNPLHKDALGNEKPYSIYNGKAIKSVIEGSGLFVQVTDEDFTFKTDSVGTDFCKKLLEAVLDFETGPGELSFARALVASIGQEAARMATSESEEDGEVGNIIFVCEYLMGMPIVSAIVVSIKCETQTNKNSLNSRPCLQKHSATKITTDWELHKQTYLFLTPTLIRKYAADLDRIIYEPEYTKAVTWLQNFVETSSSRAWSGQMTQRAIGHWSKPYKSCFPFSIEGKQFFFGQDLDSGDWVIQQLLAEGQMGEQTDSGHWKGRYETIFPFFIDGKQFFYAQTSDISNYWFVQELLPNGKMGEKVTDEGHWSNFYAVAFPFKIGNRQFFYGHSTKSKDWFVQELLPNGKMGKETDNGHWKNPYAVAFPFKTGDRQFFYGQNLDNKDWFIRELLTEGKMGGETDKGYWKNPYAVAFPFKIGDRQFFYTHNLDTKCWFVRELLSNGQMGENTVDNGRWNHPYEVSFSYQIAEKQYFYGQTLDTNDWFVQELDYQKK